MGKTVLFCCEMVRGKGVTFNGLCFKKEKSRTSLRSQKVILLQLKAK